MTASAPRVRRRSGTRSRLLPLLLTIALLLPVALLAGQAHRTIDADRALIERERLGVAYLRALGPVTEALVDAQSAAITRQPVPSEALRQAVDQVAAVDARIGGELRTEERWTGIRAKLEALLDRSLTDPEDAFAAYGEVTDLLLALHDKVRDSSGLRRDAGVDSHFLQDGVGKEMPEALVAAGRLTDLAVLIEERPASEQVRSIGELATHRVAALTPANELVNNLRAVMDGAESADLGANVLIPFDTYQRGIEAMALSSQPDRTGALDVAQLTEARRQVQDAAKQLQPVLLDEIDRLLAARIDQLDRENLLILGAAGIAGLLLVALAVTGWLSRPRDNPSTIDAPGSGTENAGSGQPTGNRWEQTAAQRPPMLVGQRHNPDRWRPFDAAR